MEFHHNTPRFLFHYYGHCRNYLQKDIPLIIENATKKVTHIRVTFYFPKSKEITSSQPTGDIAPIGSRCSSIPINRQTFNGIQEKCEFVQD